MISAHLKQAGILNMPKNPHNFSRGLLQAASLMNGTVSVSRITFPCCVRHVVFSKRRHMTVFFSHNLALVHSWGFLYACFAAYEQMVISFYLNGCFSRKRSPQWKRHLCFLCQKGCISSRFRLLKMAWLLKSRLRIPPHVVRCVLTPQIPLRRTIAAF
jgi:hypothetical protein